MTRIVLVRHGRTEWNKGEIFRGTVDIPLDEQGRKEAACAKDWLKETPFDAAYSSPLGRAVETAEIILQPHGLAVHKHQRRSEKDVPRFVSTVAGGAPHGGLSGRRRTRRGARKVLGDGS